MFYEIIVKNVDMEKIFNAASKGGVVELFRIEAGHIIVNTLRRDGDFVIQCDDGKPDNYTVDIGVSKK